MLSPAQRGCRAWARGTSTNHTCLLPLVYSEYSQTCTGHLLCSRATSPDLRQDDQGRHGDLWEHRGWGLPKAQPTEKSREARPAWGRSDPLLPPQPPASRSPPQPPPWGGSALSRPPHKGLSTPFLQPIWAPGGQACVWGAEVGSELRVWGGDDRLTGMGRDQGDKPCWT